MKILFATKYLMPEERGVAFAVAMMCKALAEVGNRIELVVPSRQQKEQFKQTDFWEYYQTRPNLYCLTKVWCWELPTVSFLEPLFVHLRYMVMSWTYSVAFIIYAYHHRSTVLYLFHECKEILFILNLVRPFYQPVVIYEVHHPPAESYNRILDAVAVGRSDLLVANTQATADYYISHGFPAWKACGCHVGVNLDDVDYRHSKKELRKMLGLPQGKIIVGYGGRFVTMGMEKGISELVKAIVLLRKKYKNIFLICVGGPKEYADKYVRLASEIGLTSGEAIFLDGVPVRVLYQYMRAFDVCVMPFPWTDHYAYKMSPLKMFEYMASKNPLVATDLPVIHEVLEDGANSVLVSPGDPKDLARGIELVISDSRLAARIARKAFEQVSNHYTWKARAKRISETVASLYSDRFLPR